MSRLVLIVVLIAAVLAAASLVASAFGRPSEAGLPAPRRRTGAIQKIAYTLLVTVMSGVAVGWLGSD